MAKKITQSELKKKLQAMEQKDLLDLTLRIYKNVPEAANYVNIEFGNEEYLDELVEKVKKKIDRVFEPRGRLTLSKAKSEITAFKRICRDIQYVIELQLYYVECGVDFTNTFGDIDDAFYGSIESVYKNIIDTLNSTGDKELYERFEYRLKKILENTGGIGWGFHENLTDIFHRLKWADDWEW